MKPPHSICLRLSCIFGWCQPEVMAFIAPKLVLGGFPQTAQFDLCPDGTDRTMPFCVMAELGMCRDAEGLTGL